ncbi:MAG: hydantoinase/oxoprolinase family protein, partial [Alphaproteobacteria bacterium]|nr:hydantoinase/oxoprolinase family protein [Alphaproteobacteria bacterium]
KDGFLGGAMGLDEAAARRVIDDLARKLAVEPREAAEGVITVLNANMANAIRSRTVQKGIDPRDFALVAFGGAGPLHGAEVAALLGIPELIVPPHPGITSAVGLLAGDLRYDAVRTSFQSSPDVDLVRLNAGFDAMTDELARRFSADGIARTAVAFERSGDLRYAGQGYELRVPVPPEALDRNTIAKVFESFHALHGREYGHHFQDSAIEIVNIRLAGTAEAPKIAAPPPPPDGSLDDARVRTGSCVFRVEGRLADFETTFYRRDRLPLDRWIPGPAIVLQMDTTSVVPPRHVFLADRAGNLIIRREEPRP